MKIALDARVSTQDQNPDVQLEPLRAYADRRGTASEEFVDHGVSGRRERRPALDRLLVAAHRREFNAGRSSASIRVSRSKGQPPHFCRCWTITSITKPCR